MGVCLCGVCVSGVGVCLCGVCVSVWGVCVCGGVCLCGGCVWRGVVGVGRGRGCYLHSVCQPLTVLEERQIDVMLPIQ